MNNNFMIKTHAMGIIILFVVASIIPSTFGIVKEKTVLMNLSSNGYIQGLINDASDGDTIFITSGTYYEHNININKSINLIGEDKNSTIIDGDKIGDIIIITVDWVNISGFTIQNSGFYYIDYYAGIVINSPHNNVTGNIIKNCDDGIRLNSVDYNNINNNIILDCHVYGISLDNSEYNNIISNSITNTSYGYCHGIFISGESNYNNIINNTFTKNDFGIVIGTSLNNILENNILVDNYCGIDLYESTRNVINNNTFSNNELNLDDTAYDNIISNNSFFNTGLFIDYDYLPINENIYYFNIVTNNTVNSKPLVYLYDEYDLLIDNDVGQIILINCKYITIQNQEIFNTIGGVQILDSNNCMVKSNTIKNNGGDIIVNYGSKITISDNNIDSIGFDTSYYNSIINNTLSGIELISSDYNNIINNDIEYGSIGLNRCNNNTISNNTICSIYIGSSNNYNNIINNIIKNNNKGIELDCANNYNKIINNTIKNNNMGVHLDMDNNYNKIIDNIITNNKNGIYIEKSNDINYYNNDNIIYHNSFINNTNNAIDFSNNTWDDGKKGNYWSDYDEKYPDAHKLFWKGIWDTPYEIPGGGDNQDNFPLIKPFKKPRNRIINTSYQNILRQCTNLLYLISV